MIAFAALFIDKALVKTIAEAPNIEAVGKSINPEAAAIIVVRNIVVERKSFFFCGRYFLVQSIKTTSELFFKLDIELSVP